MKKLIDIQVIHTVNGVNFNLDEGYTGKVLVDSNNYFEGVVREHRSKNDNSFVFGYLEDYKNIDFMKVFPGDEVTARRIVGGCDGISYQGNSFPNGNEDSEDARGVVVFTVEGERIREVTDEEVTKLESMINNIKGNLGLVGREIYSSSYTGETAKQNVKC